MWRQGQHIAIIGSTGSGKTTLSYQVLKLRQYVIAIRTKSDPFRWLGYRAVKKQRDLKIRTGESNKFLLSPGLDAQGDEIDATISQVMREGGWTILFDEMFWIQNRLGLAKRVEDLLTQGRSNNISVLVGAQRPAHLTRFAISEPQYIICNRLNDGRDIDIVKEFDGRDYAQFLTTLGKYEFGFLDRGSREQSVVTRDNVRDAFN